MMVIYKAAKLPSLDHYPQNTRDFCTPNLNPIRPGLFSRSLGRGGEGLRGPDAEDQG